jgi:hypothetical protein
VQRIRSNLRQSSALAIASVALVFSLGGGVGYAASNLSATTVTFHPLKLIDGFKASPFAGIQYPSYAVSNGVVYITGGLAKGTSKSAEFAVLPAGARPAHLEYLAVVNDDPQAGDVYLTVMPSGEMTISGPAFGPYQPLDGVSFPLTA